MLIFSVFGVCRSVLMCVEVLLDLFNVQDQLQECVWCNAFCVMHFVSNFMFVFIFFFFQAIKALKNNSNDIVNAIMVS